MKRINSTGDLLCGKIFIVDDFIYIKSSRFDPRLKKLDWNLEIINVVPVPVPPKWSVSSTYDSFNKRILVFSNCDEIPIHIDVYNLYLRKTSEINTTSISKYFSNANLWRLSSVSYYNNQMYMLYYQASFSFERNMFVTDSNGQLIGIYQLKKSNEYLDSFFINDYFGNILYTYKNHLCLLNLTTNITIGCTEAYPITWYIIWLDTYLNMDQSGRLVLLNNKSN